MQTLDPSLTYSQCLLTVDLCSTCLFLLRDFAAQLFKASYCGFSSNHRAHLAVSSLKVLNRHLRERRFCWDISCLCGIHMQVNNSELSCVETDLLYQLRISPNFPSALSPSLFLSLSLPLSFLSRWPTLIRQTVIPQWATFSFPLRPNRRTHKESPWLLTPSSRSVGWTTVFRGEKKGGGVESTGKPSRCKTGTSGLVGLYRLVHSYR